MKMNLLKVKGGNTIDNKAVVLSATLDINGLRAFQKKSLDEQKTDGRFKKTPPDYDKAKVDIRVHNRFIYQYTDWNDACVANIVEIGMRY